MTLTSLLKEDENVFTIETAVGMATLWHWGDRMTGHSGPSKEYSGSRESADRIVIVNKIPCTWRSDFKINWQGKWQCDSLSAYRMDGPYSEDATPNQRSKIFKALSIAVDEYSQTSAGERMQIVGLIALHEQRRSGQLNYAMTAEREMREHQAKAAEHLRAAQCEYERLVQFHFPIDEVLATDPGEPND